VFAVRAAYRLFHQEIKYHYLPSEVKILTAEAEDYLCTLAWPGNVRQLENICRWITVMASGREIHLSDLPPELLPDYKVNASNSCKYVIPCHRTQNKFSRWMGIFTGDSG
jgi:two-component system nitrogen regulation response regulator GlnG